MTKYIYIFNFHGIDSFIQKTKQRYNNTRTLTSRLNLSEMSEDLHNNPPFQISQSELGPENNTDVKTYKTGGKYAVCFYCRTTKTPCTCSFLNKSKWITYSPPPPTPTPTPQKENTTKRRNCCLLAIHLFTGNMYSDFSYLADVLFLNEVAFAT